MPVASDTALDEALPVLRRAGIEVTEPALHLPSLDEVVHALTENAPTENAPTKERELV